LAHRRLIEHAAHRLRVVILKDLNDAILYP
jgi:hypothetical protein